VTTRRAFLSTLAGGLFAVPLAARAQPAAKVARVGFLGTTLSPTLDAFTDGLRQLDWVEGQNLILERRFSEGRQERFRELAAELVRAKVDVIVTSGTPASVAAKGATTSIPIVMAVVMDPIETGLVASLARPGGNITGNAWLGPELTAKRLELLKDAVPRVSRVATIFNPKNPSHPIALREMQTTARRLGMTLQLQQMTSPDDFDQAFTAITRNRPDALFTVADPLYFRERTRILEFAAKRRLPAMYEWREYVEWGGLMAYGVNVKDLLRRAATYVDKILRGAKPADLPIEQPTKFELVINLKTAKALGLTIPPSVLGRADEVIHP
jgi:putative ABC transport system substrate-binding protein